MRALAGRLAVLALRLVGNVPLGLPRIAGALVIPFYPPFRPATRARLRRHSPGVTPLLYYRTRLDLALLSLRHAMNRPDGMRHSIRGASLFDEALASGRPVALLGWHQGPVELLHKIPASHLCENHAEAGRGVFLMTASAFSPALADWMASGRTGLRGGAGVPTRVIRPGDTAALRSWSRHAGVLAVMVDQAPGEPADYLTVRAPGGRPVSVPWPHRLMEWIVDQNAEILAVSVLREPGAHITFSFHAVEGPGDIRELRGSLGLLMEQALARAPEQYNWSYGKIRP